MKVYQYPKCSTCKKAMAYLASHNVEAEVVDIKEQPPTVEELKQVLAAYEGQLRRLFNTSGIQYRELGLKDRLQDMSEAEALELLSQNGMLVKRPMLLSADGQASCGFREAEWAQVLDL